MFSLFVGDIHGALIMKVLLLKRLVVLKPTLEPGFACLKSTARKYRV